MPHGKGHPPTRDITGQKFGRLTALELVENKRVTRAGKKTAYYKYWRCLCDCGSSVIVRQCHLTTEASQSCGCLMLDLKRAGRKPSVDLVKAQLHCRYKISASKKGREFTLTPDQVWKLSQQNCAWCGREPSMIIKPQHRNAEGFTYNGLDRLNSDLGYTSSNVVPCCDQCNIAKSNYTIKEFRDWIERIYHKQFVEV